jgi:hypothetical protein
MVDTNNGGRSLAQIEEDLYGPTEERRRPGRIGLMERVSRLEGRMDEREAHEKELQAVSKTKRIMVTTMITVGMLMLTLIGLMVRIMGAVS